MEESSAEHLPVEDTDEFNDSQAEWAVRKLAHLESELERVRAQTALLLKRHRSDLAQFTWYALPRLERWLDKKLAADPKKRKSVITPYGTVRKVRVKRRVVIDIKEAESDMGRNLDWWNERALTRYSPDPAGMRTYFEATGELLPGMRLEESREEVRVCLPSKGQTAAAAADDADTDAEEDGEA